MISLTEFDLTVQSPGLTTSGNFTVYSVALADYDLFTNLATQAGQTTLLSNPSLVNVYIDTNTQMLNSVAPALGGTLRFYGLVFNDSDTLRLDCSQVSDGVTGSSQTAPTAQDASAAKSAGGTVRVVHTPRV
jgi:hypothetical protein